MSLDFELLFSGSLKMTRHDVYHGPVRQVGKQRLNTSVSGWLRVLGTGRPKNMLATPVRTTVDVKKG